MHTKIYKNWHRKHILDKHRTSMLKFICIVRVVLKNLKFIIISIFIHKNCFRKICISFIHTYIHNNLKLAKLFKTIFFIYGFTKRVGTLTEAIIIFQKKIFFVICNDINYLILFIIKDKLE